MGTINTCWQFELIKHDVKKQKSNNRSSNFNLILWHLVLVLDIRFMHGTTELKSYMSAGDWRTRLLILYLYQTDHVCKSTAVLVVILLSFFSHNFLSFYTIWCFDIYVLYKERFPLAWTKHESILHGHKKIKMLNDWSHIVYASVSLLSAFQLRPNLMEGFCCWRWQGPPREGIRGEQQSYSTSRRLVQLDTQH